MPSSLIWTVSQSLVVFDTLIDMYLIEEFFMAACEQKELAWAQFFLQVIRVKFPKSVKAMRFLGIFYEAQGQVIKAQEIYLDLIDQNPSDGQSIKRLVCLFRDMEMLSSALTVLNKYVEVNQEDHEAWLELSDIYLSKGNYSKALFCLEEVLAVNPKNYLLNLRYAELLYSADRKDRIGDLLNARKYFSHAAILKEDEKEPCVRALFGLVRTCK